MTTRESEILKIIHENPMMSQQEIADALNITRASVSVHIANMIKNGDIKGRGYVVREDKYIIIIGTSALDIRIDLGNTNRDIDPLTSQVKFDIDFAYHGSAKDLAENLVRLDFSPYLISVLANDQFGSHIEAECNQHGISTDYCLFLDNSSTTMFLDLKGQGINISGMTGNHTERNITPKFLESKYTNLKKASQIVLEDRLSRESIDYVTSNFRDQPLYLITSRRLTNIPNYIDFLDRFYAMQFSFLVASNIVGMDNHHLLGKTVSDDLIMSIAKKLIEHTHKSGNIVFPAPGGNICYIHKASLYVVTTPFAAKELDSFSRTRDAMMAGLIYCLSKNISPEETLLFISSCNDIMLNSDQHYSHNMCINLVQTTLKQISENYTVRKLF